MYLENSDYFVRVVPLPYAVRGMTVTNPDGTFSVYLNSRNTFEQDEKTKAHELDHIANGDFFSGKAIEDIENDL